jgi:serine protease Do
MVGNCALAGAKSNMHFLDSLRKQKFLSFALILFTLAIGILIGTLVNTGVKAAKDQVAAPGATPLSVPSPVQMQSQFVAIAKQVEPTVVNISTEIVQKPAASSRRPQRKRTPNPEAEPNGEDEGNMQDWIQRFFGGSGGGMLEIPQSPQKESSLGSGVVVDHNGYILTNNHVVENATRIRVKFPSEDTQYDAHVIGTDPLTDLAVVKVDKTNLTAAAIGNSDAIQVGDWAIAIGSPFGFNETMTVGIISAKERDIPGDASSFQHFLQTDAAINPGNSGGPLLNIRGEVIGINTMIASRNGGYQGIGFAMPINTAVKVYNEIIKNGQVVRGSIGVYLDPENNTDLLKAYGAKTGVFVEKLQPGGPAEKVGIKPEDILTSINGKTIKKGQDLIDEVAETPVGNSVSISLLRDGKPETLKVTVGDRAKVFGADPTKADEPKESPEENTSARFGISIQPLTPGMKQNMGFTGTGGVVVSTVEPGSFAEDIGLRKQDVIVAINRQPISSIEDVQRIQKTLKNGDSVAMRVMRRVRTEWQTFYPAGKLGNTQ